MPTRENCAPYKLIQEYLKEDHLSIHNLSKKLGISHRNVQHYIVLLRERGLVRIAEYSRLNPGKGGCPTPLYTLGKKDAPRPVPFTNNECSARNRAKNRAQVNARKTRMTQMLRSMGLL